MNGEAAAAGYSAIDEANGGRLQSWPDGEVLRRGACQVKRTSREGLDGWIDERVIEEVIGRVKMKVKGRPVLYSSFFLLCRPASATYTPLGRGGVSFVFPYLVVGGTTMTGKAGLRPGKWLCMKSYHRCFGGDGAAALALRAACSGIEIKYYTHQT